MVEKERKEGELEEEEEEKMGEIKEERKRER